MGIAARVDAWQKRSGKYGGFYGYQSGSAPTSTTSTGLKVEIFVNESWVNISPDVRYASRVAITGGRSDEASQLQRSTCKFSLNNRDGKYSPRNPASPFYGKIGRNTLCRVSVEQVGTTRYRIYGEIVAWPVQWDTSDTDVWVPVEASGVLRRLNQGAKPLRSSMYRTITRETIDHIKAYWPCEDASGATSFGSAISGGLPMVITGSVSPASYSGFAASDSIPTLGVGAFTGIVPTYTLDAADVNGIGPFIRARFLLNVPSGGTTNGAVLFRMATTGSTSRIDVIYLTTSAGSLRLVAYDTAGVQIDVPTDLTTSALNGKDVIVSVIMRDNAITDLISGLEVFYDDGTATTNTLSIISGAHVGRVKTVSVTPDSNCSGISVGHVWFQTDFVPDLGLQSLLDGHKGESAFTRISRLCNEESISFAGTDPGGNNTTLGVQNIDTLINLLNDCAKADMGLLFETRDQLGIGYRTLPSLYNQSPKLTMSYTTNDLLSPATPVDDDQQTKNDIEMHRLNGASARIIQTTGTLSVLPPPSGVGLYDISDTININTDSQLADQVAWRLRLGTVDEPRYPAIDIHLQRNTFVNSYDLTAAALTLGIGDRILITGQPVHEGGTDINVIAQAYTEAIDQFEHQLSFNGAPESPYHVGLLNSTTLGRADTSGSVLRSPLSSTNTTVVVSITSGPRWTPDPAEFPFDILVGGEVMTVASIAESDGDFELTGTGWSGSSCTIAQSSAQRRIGNFSGLMTVTGAPAQAFFRNVTQAFVTPGNSYTLQFWSFCVAGYADANIAIDWLTADGSYITTSAGAGSTTGVSVWLQRTFTATAPAGAALAIFGPTLGSNPPAGTAVFYDSISFTPWEGQTFTVTRSVNGVVKAQTAGTDVRLSQPMILSL